MGKDLERDLGLYATLTISIGAMIGSGIFVLPGLAYKFAGPAVILAYLLGGLIVIPAALSKSEMATAMPEAGGTYLYIDRAMGPLMGTIAGVGAWFSLVFKSSFALVGLGAYLVLYAPLPIRPIALGLAVLLVGVNVVGVKQTGRLQAGIVTVVLSVLAVFIADGLTEVQSANYDPFLAGGAPGLLAATGFIFVSYAGVTKIASVAEEVEDPGRTLPIAMIGSVLVMMLVYTLVVFVIVGILPDETVTNNLTAMATTAETLLGPYGDLIIAGVAVLALTSMANAGILSSSRFPFAMSRDELAPPSLARIHPRFRTPVVAIGVTGALLVVLVAFVPVVQLAKLASAFKILIFSLVNVAVIAFRESDLATYDPEFVAPGYPWVQLFGIGGGVVLLTQMGPLPMAGAGGIVLAGLLWYRLYGREGTEREGAALDAIRQTSSANALERTEAAFEESGDWRVVVPFGGQTDEASARTLLALADGVVPGEGAIQAVRFEEVPEQIDLSAARAPTDADAAYEALINRVAADARQPVTPSEIVSHNTRRALATYVRDNEIDVMLGEWHPDRLRAELLGTDVDWYMRTLDVNLLFVRDRGGIEAIDRIVVATEEGPYDPLEVVAADALARTHGATIEFLPVIGETATPELLEIVDEYHAILGDLCGAETTYTLLESDDQARAVARAADGADLAVLSTSDHSLVYNVLFGSLPDRLVERLDCTVLLAHSAKTRRHTFIRAFLDRFVY